MPTLMCLWTDLPPVCLPISLLLIFVWKKKILMSLMIVAVALDDDLTPLEKARRRRGK